MKVILLEKPLILILSICAVELKLKKCKTSIDFGVLFILKKKRMCK